MSVNPLVSAGAASPAADPTRYGAAWERPLPAGSEELAQRVARAIGPQRRLGVAFSGGVDSSVLLALAARALGPDRTVAILGVSASLAAEDRRDARAAATQIGAQLVELVTHEAANPAYRANGPDRCFHCKDELFARISEEVVDQHGLSAVAYGENADDLVRPDRPGSHAASAHRVLRPLADAGLTKSDVRAVARDLGLASADRPAAPCLASRIPHFETVTPEKLQQVEVAEAALRSLGFRDSRVRHHGEVARIELPAADLLRAIAEPTRGRIHQAVRAAGFRFVALDVAGIQSGAFTLPLVASDG